MQIDYAYDLKADISLDGKVRLGAFLVVQWLRLLASTAGGTGSIPGLGTKILHVLRHVQKKKLQKRDGPASVNMHAAQLIVCQLLS